LSTLKQAPSHQVSQALPTVEPKKMCKYSAGTPQPAYSKHFTTYTTHNGGSAQPTVPVTQGPSPAAAAAAAAAAASHDFVGIGAWVVPSLAAPVPAQGAQSLNQNGHLEGEMFQSPPG